MRNRFGCINLIELTPKIINTEFVNIEENKIRITGNILNPGPNEMNIIVNLLVDRDQSTPIDEIKQSEIIVINSDEKIEFNFSINKDTFPKTKIYVIVQTEYNNNYIITDQLE